MEHAVSDRLIDRIDSYLGHPKADPHGDPIPRSDGSFEMPASRLAGRVQGRRRVSPGSRDRSVARVPAVPERLGAAAGRRGPRDGQRRRGGHRHGRGRRARDHLGPGRRGEDSGYGRRLSESGNSRGRAQQKTIASAMGGNGSRGAFSCRRSNRAYWAGCVPAAEKTSRSFFAPSSRGCNWIVLSSSSTACFDWPIAP